ncbi:MAG TPA: uracil-DNA glycosylase family protein [Stellaceae bacterium]|nr:uracil-DNA glycosylase family protein [Stellaceae bacterium]
MTISTDPPACPPLADLIAEIRACRVCAAHLPRPPRPILRGEASARLLIISQAPGTKAHETGLSFNDRSGDRLRSWLGMTRAQFYDERLIAIAPIGFCYPGRAPKGGDLPPRPDCAALWQAPLQKAFAAIELILLVGSYAIDYHLGAGRHPTMTETVAHYHDYLPRFLPLPHPSWRTTAWEQRHPWFAASLLPDLKSRIAALLAG